MLQIVSGKFFDLNNVYETWHRGAFFTNYRLWSLDGLSTPIGKIYSAVSNNGPLMLTYELLERLPKGDGPKPGVLMSTGGAALVNDFSAVLSFALDITCTPDPDLARRLVVDERPTLGSSVLPRKLVPRVFDKEVPAVDGDENKFNAFLAKVISLRRSDYELVMRAVRQYVVATHRLSDNPDLAYAVFVAALESLAQQKDAFRPTWNDFEERKRLAIDTALDGAADDVAERVRSALLDIEHTKLKSRFIGFTLKHIKPGYFREETNPNIACIGRADLSKALSGAYDLRSQYVHNLKPIPRHLTISDVRWEYSNDGDGPLLNFAGIARLVRHVILNFVESCEAGEDENFNHIDALPNVMTMRLSSQYWIANVAGFSKDSALSRLAAHYEEYSLAVIRSPDAKITDISDVMRKIEQVLPTLTKPDDRVSMIALYFSFNLIVPAEMRSANWQTWRETLEPELHRASIPALFLFVLHRHQPDWDLAKSVELTDRYFATKFHKREMDVGNVGETILLLWLAEQFRVQGLEGDARAYISRAVENSPANLRLRKFETELAGSPLNPIEWFELLRFDTSEARAPHADGDSNQN